MISAFSWKLFVKSKKIVAMVTILALQIGHSFI